VRFGILCLPHDDGGSRCGLFEDDPYWEFRYTIRFGYIGCRLFMVYKSIRIIYWTIHRRITKGIGSLPCIVLLYLFGMVDSIVLRTSFFNPYDSTLLTMENGKNQPLIHIATRSRDP